MKRGFFVECSHFSSKASAQPNPALSKSQRREVVPGVLPQLLQGLIPSLSKAAPSPLPSIFICAVSAHSSGPPYPSLHITALFLRPFLACLPSLIQKIHHFLCSQLWDCSFLCSQQQQLLQQDQDPLFTCPSGVPPPWGFGRGFGPRSHWGQGPQPPEGPFPQGHIP